MKLILITFDTLISILLYSIVFIMLSKFMLSSYYNLYYANSRIMQVIKEINSVNPMSNASFGYHLNLINMNKQEIWLMDKLGFKGYLKMI